MTKRMRRGTILLDFHAFTKLVGKSQYFNHKTVANLVKQFIYHKSTEDCLQIFLHKGSKIGSATSKVTESSSYKVPTSAKKLKP